MIGDELTTQLDLATRGGGSPERRAYLLVHMGPQAQLRILEDGESIVVGRASDADVVVDDSRVSRRNTELTLRGHKLVVRDLGGRNGTRIGSEALHGGEREIGRAQELSVGPARIVVVSLPQEQEADAADDEVIAVDDAMRAVLALVRKVAVTPATVLIRGETGVGKEVVAELLHRHSPRRERPLVRLNCAAVPHSLLESELFGHEKGSFTGASEQKLGYLEIADGGTLFLDEIGDVPPEVQVKLLRALETQRVTRIGGRDEIALDVRIVCATHRELEEMVAAGNFRQDLYYRVAGFVIAVPPLRDRPRDLMPLAQRLSQRFAQRLGQAPPAISDEAMAVLARHPWPGNVRELRNAMEHAVVLAGTAPIGVEHLPGSVTRPRAADGDGSSMRDTMDDAERRAIEQALATSGGHRARAAEILGVSKRTLQYKLAKHGIKG